jgi:hypothetical protein
LNSIINIVPTDSHNTRLNQTFSIVKTNFLMIRCCFSIRFYRSRLVKGLQFELLCRMNHPDAIQQATILFKSIPIDYFNNTDVNIK